MPATMKKANKVYDCDDLTAIDWGRIKNATGKPIPPLAKKEVKDIIKKTERGKYKSPYAKLGLVDGCMVLRVKDGSKYLADVILLTPEDAAAPVNMPTLSATEQREVDAFRQSKDDLVANTKAALSAFQGELRTAKDRLGDIKDYVAAIVNPSALPAQRASDMQRVADRVQELNDLHDDLDNRYNNDVVGGMMNLHRSSTGRWYHPPAAATGDLQTQLRQYSSIRLSKAIKTQGLIRGIAQQVKSVAKLAETLKSKGENALHGHSSRREAELAALSRIATQLQSDFDAASEQYNESTNKPSLLLGSIGNHIDLVDAPGTTMSRMHELIGLAMQKVKLCSGINKEIQAQLSGVERETQAAVADLDKNLLKDREFKPIVKNPGRHSQRSNTPEKSQQQGHRKRIKEVSTVEEESRDIK